MITIAKPKYIRGLFSVAALTTLIFALIQVHQKINEATPEIEAGAVAGKKREERAETDAVTASGDADGDAVISHHRYRDFLETFDEEDQTPARELSTTQCGGLCYNDNQCVGVCNLCGLVENNSNNRVCYSGGGGGFGGNLLVSCVDDFECGPNFFCDRTGQCIRRRVGCRFDSDCGPGSFCDINRSICVVRFGCSSDFDCAPGKFCRGNICVAGGNRFGCSTNLDCRRDQVCSGNICVNRGGGGTTWCNRNAQCGSGLCDIARGRCVQGGTLNPCNRRCFGDADCNQNSICPFCNAVPGRQGVCFGSRGVAPIFRGTDRSRCSQLCNNVDAFCSGACGVCDFSYSNLDGTCIE